ncbi:hypothetical protein ROHU_024964 [Labeo rohita]|uniref:Uncharacterized protein n=1 Tax=Labeo rohita TaxID=84645 RepID=A0A498MM20_LABRO|nr:hypothetical protein ROHU_024964 [Labeo rohita]
MRDIPLWGDIIDSESPEFTPLFDQQLLTEGDEIEGDEEENEMLTRLLQEELDDEEEDAILSAAQASSSFNVVADQ